jgi:hypothetical protein
MPDEAVMGDTQGLFCAAPGAVSRNAVWSV